MAFKKGGQTNFHRKGEKESKPNLKNKEFAQDNWNNWNQFLEYGLFKPLPRGVIEVVEVPIPIYIQNVILYHLIGTLKKL